MDDEGDHEQGRGHEVRQEPPADVTEERAEVQPPGGSGPGRDHGATSARATSAPTSRIGSSQTPGKTSGATRATKALASAPPSERIR